MVIPPEVEARLIRTEQKVDPDPVAPSILPDLPPGETVKIAGYLDLNAEGLSKRDLVTLADSITLRIVGADGRELLSFPRRPPDRLGTNGQSRQQ